MTAESTAEPLTPLSVEAKLRWLVSELMPTLRRRPDRESNVLDIAS